MIYRLLNIVFQIMIFSGPGMKITGRIRQDQKSPVTERIVFIVRRDPSEGYKILDRCFRRKKLISSFRGISADAGTASEKVDCNLVFFADFDQSVPFASVRRPGFFRSDPIPFSDFRCPCQFGCFIKIVLLSANRKTPSNNTAIAAITISIVFILDLFFIRSSYPSFSKRLYHSCFM